MLDKLKAGLAVLRYGNEVTNVEAWKKGQITGTILGALLIALANMAQAFGYPFPLDTDSANVIGAGIVGVVNVILTAATSKRSGILPTTNTNSNPDSVSDQGMQNQGISQETRDAALRYSGKAIDPLAGLDTTYYP